MGDCGGAAHYLQGGKSRTVATGWYLTVENKSQFMHGMALNPSQGILEADVNQSLRYSIPISCPRPLSPPIR